jgi:CheY-like chemotaxis protein
MSEPIIPPLKILLVEDNEMNLDMLTRRLQRSGFAVSQSLDGLAAVARATAEAPDLVLMDVGLPKLSGLDAIRQLRLAEKTKNLKIIALTAHALSGDLENAIAAGADEYATKPIDYPGLLEKINAITGRSK